MSTFFQIIGCVMITVIFGVTLKKHNADIATVLILCVCCMVVSVMANFLEPILAFVREVLQLGRVNTDLLKPVIKATGVGLITEIASLICSDSGNAALGKSIQLLAAAVILYLSMPLLNALLEFMQRMLSVT